MSDEWPGQRLHQFAIFDREDCMIDILQGIERQNINAPDIFGRTPVYTAVSNNSIKCLEILLQHGADPSTAGGERVNFMSPLHQALLEGKEDAIKLLLRYGADLNKKDRDGYTPINLAHRISVDRYIQLFDQEKDRRHSNALLVVKDLCEAVEIGDLEKVKDILRLPAPIGWELANMAVPDNEDKKTPLVVAAYKGDVVIMSELLSTVAIPKQSPSLIHIAIEADNIDIVKLLLERFPDCSLSEDDRNYTPLHKACQIGSLSMVRCLMDWNYPDHLYKSLCNIEENVYYKMVILVNAKTSDGKTPLYLACEGGHETIVEYLVNYTVIGKKGDNDRESFWSGQSALSDSVKSELEMSFKPVEVGINENETFQKSRLNFGDDNSVVQYRPTKIQMPDNFILSSVYIAVKNGHLQVVDLLVNSGADLNFKVFKNGKEYAVLLLIALEKNDILMLDKLLFYKVHDVDNNVLEEAVKVKPDFIPHFLKYKSSEDKHYSINRNLMKKEYNLTSVSAERVEELPSANPQYQKTFPIQPIIIRWQNLKVLSSIETSWLTCAANLYNPLMNNVNVRVPLFAITKVDVSNNSLVMLPVSLLQLPSLCILSVANNKITDFPQHRNFSLDCQCLEDLDVQCNEIVSIPSYIFQLPNLRAVHAGKNKIGELPSCMWQAHTLRSLDLTCNKLKKLPIPVCLEDVTINSTDVETQSVAFMNSLTQSTHDLNQSELLVLSTLKRANHWSQSLVIADEGVVVTKTDQKGLKSLKLGRNMITEFPEFLSCCAPYLETLDMSNNRLVCLGNLGCYPLYLKSLDLSRNQIKSMEDWKKAEEGSRCYSTRLVGHSSSTDQSSQRPMSAVSFSVAICGHRTHTKLANLETFDLSMNKITSLVLLRTEAKKVQDLHSSMQSLQAKEEMEQDLQGRLLFPNMMALTIDGNQLTELPMEIGELKVLRILSLKKNVHLKQRCFHIFAKMIIKMSAADLYHVKLPPTLGLLEKLHRIEVEMCPIEGPIHDVIKGAANKAAHITGFLRSILEESEEYNCMNLMLVGSHNIGKTTLLEQISKKGILPCRKTHFNERQNGKGSKGTTPDGKPLSTVGIDINRLVLDGNHGKVEFRTWDFAGQKEYYATHQYFLRPRSLYLAVWNLKDAEPGVEGLRQWLVNIQAQAPGAPVIIVGTHLDEIKGAKKGYTKDWDESMIAAIRDKYMKIDNNYIGLPRVLDAINIGCGKKVLKVDKLKDLIYEKVFSLTHPERKSEKLLGHKVPKKYLDLQICLQNIVKERLENNREPVLDSDSYLISVMNEMESSKTYFRNKDDLYQATRFLHENGVLCHFADTSLKDQYFLEPQWLCDQLAKVVSIQEVQKYSNEGVMKVKDLYHVYKNSDKIGKYILGLLNKFEVAIQFDQDHLLLPSLLPTDQKLEPSRMKEIPVKRQGTDLTTQHPESIHSFGNSNFFQSIPTHPQGEMFIVCTSADKNPAMSNTRLYLLTYFPSGFWPRLITRILADDSFHDPMMRMYQFPQDIVDKCSELQKTVPYWRCWQTGIELVYFGNVIFQVKEIRSESDYAQGICNYDNEGIELQCFFDDAWSALDIQGSSVLELSFQADKITFNFGFQESVERQHFQSVEERHIYHDERAKASILAKLVEHIDALLQDWYPEIGESRFMQSCTGRFLVTRVIPCPLCLQTEFTYQHNSPNNWVVFNTTSDQPRSLSLINSEPDTVSHNESTDIVEKRVLYTFLVERCIKNVLEGMDEVCLTHRAVSSTYMPTGHGANRTLYLTPDLVFQDLETSIIVPDDVLEIGKRLGRGAFGVVSSGKLRRGDCTYDVAVKVMFDPGERKKINSQMSLETMCLAYTMARQECFILQSIEHPNIVPLMGLSRRPLALLLALAPLGSLNTYLDTLYNDGLRLQSWAIKQIVVQIAGALDYLHGRNIIYRDLKSDNVLVWSLPGPSDRDVHKLVHVKLADYGISRSVAHAGAKGFGGTPPFIAPEILARAGKDIYTEKVDIFSFGMFMFELLTCRQPLKEIANPTLHVSHGGRPSLTSEEAGYPSHMLDLMTVCWAQESSNRPSAAQVHMIASSPQFCHLSDAVTLDTKSTVLSACTVYMEEATFGPQGGIGDTEQTQCWIISQQGFNHYNVEILYYNLQNKYTAYQELIQDNKVCAICQVNKTVWCLDTAGKIHIYSCKSLEKKIEYQLPVNHISVVRSMICYHGNKCHRGNKENHILISLRESGEKHTVLFHLLEEDVIEQNGNLTAVKLSRECFGTAVVSTNEGLKLWLGTTCSEIMVKSLDSLENMEDDHCLCPHQVQENQQTCMFVCTSQTDPNSHSVWSYNFPGSNVNRWDSDNEVTVSTLDCASIIPATDRLVQRSQRHDASQYQVTALSVIGQYLYVATTGGCVLVADSSTLQAYSAFRCHSDEEYYCKAILPLGPTNSSDLYPDDNNSPSTEQQVPLNNKSFKRSSSYQPIKLLDPGIVTIGRGYSDLVNRVTSLEKQTVIHQDSEEDWSMVDTRSIRSTTSGSLQQTSSKVDTHVLSWIAEHWEDY